MPPRKMTLKQKHCYYIIFIVIVIFHYDHYAKKTSMRCTPIRSIGNTFHINIVGILFSSVIKLNTLHIKNVDKIHLFSLLFYQRLIITLRCWFL